MHTLSSNIFFSNSFCYQKPNLVYHSFLVESSSNSFVMVVLDMELCYLYQEPKPVSVGLVNGARKDEMKLCWLQKKNNKHSEDLWLVDDVRLLPLQTFNNTLYLQFSINMQCAGTTDNRYILYSSF